MNLTYLRVELLRQLRDVTTTMFVIGLPLAMYLIFGMQEGAGSPAGHGNVAFYIMSAMAYYGAVTGAVAICGVAAAENILGWGRTLALTRAPRWGYVLNKGFVAVAVAAVAMGVVYGVGAATGARAESWQVWAATLGISLLCLVPWAIFGIGVGLLFRSESAAGIASGGVTFFAFFGNLFIPLSGVMLDIARWTPMYGMGGLVRWPLTEGMLGPSEKDELWVLLLSAGVWTAVFIGLALLGARRATGRR